MYELGHEHICHRPEEIKKPSCNQKCILCERKCKDPRHDHDLHAEEIDSNLISADWGDFNKAKIKLHLCENEHNCKIPCSSEGVC